MTTIIPSPTLSPFKRAMRTALLSSTSPVYARILVAVVWRLPSPNCTAIVSHHAPTYPNHPTTKPTMISDNDEPLTPPTPFEAALQSAKDRVSAIALRDEMSNLSEDCWATDWLFGCEYMLWSFLQTKPGEWGIWHVSKGDVDNLRELAERCGGWWSWDEKEGMAMFVTMEKWVEVVREWDAQNPDLSAKKPPANGAT